MADHWTCGNARERVKGVLVNILREEVNIVQLRDFLRAKFPQAHEVRNTGAADLRTGVPCLDAAGVSIGGITEIMGESPGCGAGLVIAAMLEQRATAREATVLVDGCDAFDPWSVRPEALERVLWVRCRELTQAVKAADLLLRDGNVPVVLLDFQLQPLRALRGLPSSVWHRLRVLAEQSGAALCVFTPCRIVGCASSRVVLEQRFTLEDQNTSRSLLTARLRARVERQKNAAPWMPAETGAAVGQ